MKIDKNGFHLRFLFGTTEFYIFMNLLWFDLPE